MKYTFGDSAIASERLAIVAEIMGPVMQAALAPIDGGAVHRVLDLGCGPGHTTTQLATTFPAAVVIGVELSPSYAVEAKARAGTVTRADVAALPIAQRSVDVVYARYLLSHFDDVAAYVAEWARTIAADGYLVLEEPESIRSRDPDFAEYERVSSAIVRASGGTFYAGPLIAATPTPPGFTRVHDATRAIDPSAAEAASMFWRNARAWPADAIGQAGFTRDDVARLAERIRAREDDVTRGLFDWQQRQTVFRNRV